MKYWLLVLFLGSFLMAQPICKLDVQAIEKDAQKYLDKSSEMIASGSTDIEVYAIATMSAAYLYQYTEALAFIEQAEKLPISQQNKEVLAAVYAQKSVILSLIGLQRKVAKRNEESQEYYSKAAQTARNAVMLSPQNVNYASYWEMFSILAGDQEMKEVSYRYRASIDPETTKEKPVMDPVLGTVIVVGMICATWISMYAMSSPEERKIMIQLFPDLAGNLFTAVFKVIKPVSLVPSKG